MKTARRIAVIAAAAAALAMILRRAGMPLTRYAVEGPSMEPSYHEGDRVLVNRLSYRRRAPAIGEVVVLHDPERDGHTLLKRIHTAITADEVDPRYIVTGDNVNASRDSRAFGPVPGSAIIGPVVYRY